MAKYDWKQLEKEYILGDYKSVSDFFKSKQIPNNSRNRNNTKGWKEKKWQKRDKNVTKTIEKIIEKESEKEAQQIVDIKSIANQLALNVIKANKEINMYVDSKGNKKSGMIDIKGIKQLTSALKDLNDILKPNEQKEDQEGLTKVEELLSKIKEEANNDNNR